MKTAASSIRSIHGGFGKIAAFMSLTIALGCSHVGWSAPKEVKKTIEQMDVIPLEFVRTGIGLGALLIGEDPSSPPKHSYPPDKVFSKSLLDGERGDVARTEVALESGSRQTEFKMLADAAPGLGERVKLVSGKPILDFSRLRLKQVGWGSVEDATTTEQAISEAVVRAWYGLPGNQLNRGVLGKLQLDSATNAERPWFVVRALTAKGLKYQIDKNSEFSLAVGAEHPVYGSAGVGVGYKVQDSRTLEIIQPMVVGYEVAQIQRIDPPLPTLGAKSSNANGKHRFTWKRRSGLKNFTKLKEVIVNIEGLQAMDKFVAAEDGYPAPVVQRLTEEIKNAEPVRSGLYAEASPTNSNKLEWRPLEEGGSFKSDEFLRLRVVLDEPAFLYLLAKDHIGRVAVLYPQVEGEVFSIGENNAVSKKEWIFPTALNQEEGIRFENEPTGTESFVLVASKGRQEALPKALADFASAARSAVASNSAALTTNSPLTTRAAPFAFRSILRIPAGYASVPKERTNVASAAVESSVAATQPAAATTAAQEEPVRPTLDALFSGVDSATVLTVNLTREQVKKE